MRHPEAIIGPPWRPLPEGAAVGILAADPPAGVAPHAWAASSPALGLLARERGPNMAAIRAALLAAQGDGTALVLKGGIRLTSGQWLWPVVQHRVSVDKAVDPRNPADFVTLVQGARDRLVAAARGPEAEALQSLVPSVSAEAWASVSDAELDAVIDSIEADIAGIASSAEFEEAFALLGAEAEAVAGATARSMVIRGVAGSLSRPDRELARNIGRFGRPYVTDEYGRRAIAWNRDARRIIAAGARDGLDSRSIGRQMADALGGRVSGRTASYFQVVANAAIGRARSWGEVASYRDAGLGAYEWMSVMDQRTSAICEFLDGQQFGVAEAVARFQAAEAAATAQEAVGFFSWYSVQGDTIMAPEAVGSETLVPVARMEGERGPVGSNTFSTENAPQQVGGSPMPPAHGMCRSITVPVF